ncbi:MAG: hypothetical protein Fur0037_08760 [Planctomycetota bacterium]
MKQNEKVLVYAVTGFLLVILGIAILFGKDGPRTVKSAEGSVPEARSGAKESGRGLGDLFAKISRKQAQEAAARPQDAAPRDAVTGLPAPEEKPLMAPPPPTPAEQVRAELGESRRERDFRIVKVAPGDTMPGLVRKWCGSADRLAEAESLNEGLSMLRAGQEIVLPWVDDQEILAAWRERDVEPAPAARPQPAPSSRSGGVAAAAPSAAAKTYRIRSGDALWKIAVREVGPKGAPSFLQQVKALNPEILDLDHLRVGQEIRLPRRP